MSDLPPQYPSVKEAVQNDLLSQNIGTVVTLSMATQDEAPKLNTPNKLEALKIAQESSRTGTLSGSGSYTSPANFRVDAAGQVPTNGNNNGGKIEFKAIFDSLGGPVGSNLTLTPNDGTTYVQPNFSNNIAQPVIITPNTSVIPQSTNNAGSIPVPQFSYNAETKKMQRNW